MALTYDGFGNLTTVNVTKGTAPSLSVSYNAATNRRTTDSADANGNILQSGVTNYDVENRITAANITNGTARYSYAPGNKRIWRGTWVNSAQTVDELTYYSASGAKLCAYNLTVNGYGQLTATSSGYYEYFGGKLLKNATGYINQDGRGSVGKYFPYGQDRGSNPSNGSEKFATYTRDAETGLDYAQARYHSAGDGRFLSPDPYAASGGPGDPGSWNRYAYTRGDPVNRTDSSGLQDCSINGDPHPCPEPPLPPLPPYDPNRWTIDGDVCIFPGAKYDYPEQCGGGEPPPGAPPPQNGGLLDVAVDAAIKALREKPECAAIFKGGAAAAEAMLREFIAGSSRAVLEFDSLGVSKAAEAEARTVGRRPGNFFRGSTQVVITINTYVDRNDNTLHWNDANTMVNAITLIHELGHAFDFFYGPNGSRMEYDALPNGEPDPAAQARNSARTDKCK